MGCPPSTSLHPPCALPRSTQPVQHCSSAPGYGSYPSRTGTYSVGYSTAPCFLKTHLLPSQPDLLFPPQILEQLGQSLSSSQHMQDARRGAITKRLTKGPVPKSRWIDGETGSRRAKWLHVTQEGMQHQDTLVSHLPDHPSCVGGRQGEGNERQEL